MTVRRLGYQSELQRRGYVVDVAFACIRHIHCPFGVGILFAIESALREATVLSKRS